CKSTLLPICLAKAGRARRGFPAPTCVCRPPCRHPSGYFRLWLRCSAAPRGPTYVKRCANERRSGHYEHWRYSRCTVTVSTLHLLHGVVQWVISTLCKLVQDNTLSLIRFPVHLCGGSAAWGRRFAAWIGSLRMRLPVA